MEIYVLKYGILDLLSRPPHLTNSDSLLPDIQLQLHDKHTTHNIMDHKPSLDSSLTPLHRIGALRRFRPHPGIWLDQQKFKPGEAEAEDMASINTIGMDILLILLRHLISFGYAVDRIGTGIGAENAMMDAAVKNLGWKQEEDWIIKLHMHQHLAQHDAVECDGISTDIKFQELVHLPCLRNLFDCNAQFRLISPFAYIMENKSEVGTYLQSDSQEMIELNTLDFTSSQPFSTSISQHCDSVDGTQYTSLRPKFLRINYKVESPGRKISELRLLQFSAPEVLVQDSMVQKRVQHATYRLCAIVRVTDNQEKIRTYGIDGMEIIPGEVGNYKEKEPAAENPPWSVSDEGDYILFYVRMIVPPRISSRCRRWSPPRS
jgi:hypothetical protein